MALDSNEENDKRERERERERERAKKKNLKKKTTRRLFRISTFLFTFAHKTHEARGCERIRWDLLRESVIGF